MLPFSAVPRDCQGAWCSRSSGVQHNGQAAGAVTWRYPGKKQALRTQQARSSRHTCDGPHRARISSPVCCYTLQRAWLCRGKDVPFLVQNEHHSAYEHGVSQQFRQPPAPAAGFPAVPSQARGTPDLAAGMLECFGMRWVS